MPLQTVRLSKLSVCPCGYSLLKPSIKLGTIYKIDPERRDLGNLCCGGCGRITRDIPVVWTMARNPGERADYLPAEIFEEVE